MWRSRSIGLLADRVELFGIIFTPAMGTRTICVKIQIFEKKLEEVIVQVKWKG